jgi:pimeloyl-ACP methyl ester carboxylesterase
VAHADLGDRRVFYEEHGSGDPVLLVNGLGADHTAWALQTEYLRKSFRVIAFDNPGVGQTEGPPGPYTTALFADVAASLLRYLEIERAHVIGASMGGLIAQQMAVRHPAAVRSLAVHCPWWRIDPYSAALLRSWQTIAKTAGMPDLLRQIWLWVFTPRFYEEQPEAFGELERQVVESPHRQTVDAFCDQAEACLTHVALEEVAEIEVPTLITVGDTDILTPAAHAHALHERIRGSRLHIWPEMGHAPFWEISDAFNRLNRDFLESHR